MSLILKTLTLKNFLSTGQIVQTIELNNTDLTLILGENLDLGGDGAKNGCGKSVFFQSICYALFGVSLTAIKKDLMINRTNEKNMLVTLEFSVNDIEYKIERGRKPNVLRFYIDNKLQEAQDEAQGDSRETQDAIERTIKMSVDMFKQIVILNTYTEPFLAMRAADQRTIIEQLLGITLLSEKAEKLKELIKETKDQIQSEDFKIKAIEEANKRVLEQVEGLKRRHRLWSAKRNSDLSELTNNLEILEKVNIEDELIAHKLLTEYNLNSKAHDTHNAHIARQQLWLDKRDSDINSLLKDYNEKNKIDIKGELANHALLKEYNQLVQNNANAESELKRINSDILKDSKLANKLVQEITALHDHKCYACGQEFHDDQHSTVLAGKEELLRSTHEHLTTLSDKKKIIENSIVDLPTMPITIYQNESDAIKHDGMLENILNQIDAKRQETDPYEDQILELRSSLKELGPKPVTIYDNESDAINHNNEVTSLKRQIASKTNEMDPYSDQIKEMEASATQVVDFSKINDLTKTVEHQKFLLDILTNKDSFVRKKIVDQSLSYLNKRLSHYTELVGLPHQVEFMNDLQVQITEFGRELNYGNLSRGESTRVILALSWAFRDVWEQLYMPINGYYLDEVLDQGIDQSGIAAAVKVIKQFNRERNKSVWLISHRDELITSVGKVMKVVKQGGFTEYCTDPEK